MKKTILTALIALFIMSAVSVAQVSTPGLPFSVYAGGALSLPSSPEGFRDGWKFGYHGMLGLGFNVAPRIQMVGKLEYHKFQSDLDTFGGSSVDGGGIKSVMFGVDGRLNLGAPIVPINPYAIGGIGIASVQAEEYESSDPLIASSLNSSVDTESQSKVYYNFGAGVEFNLAPKASLFVQARYVNIATDGSSTGFIPVTLGLKLF